MGTWGKNIGLHDEKGAHGNVLRMWGENENCILSQLVRDIKGGAEYTLSLSTKRIFGEGASYRLEFYEEKDGVHLVNVPSFTIKNKTGDYNEAGLGFIAEVYEEEVIFRARDFAKGLWVPEHDIHIAIK